MTGDVARAGAWLDRLAEEYTDLPDVCDHCHHAAWAHRDGSYECQHKAIAGPFCRCAHYKPDPVPALLALARGVAGLADELQGWRDNAERHSNSVDIGSAVYERSMGRARAYERAIEGLAALLADAAPDEEAR